MPFFLVLTMSVLTLDWVDSLKAKKHLKEREKILIKIECVT